MLTVVERGGFLMMLLAFGGTVHGQSVIDFTCRIEGIELVGGNPRPVTGVGTLFLQGDQLHYNVQLPVIVNLPAETHFHADGTSLRVSLAPFVVTPGSDGSRASSIQYNGVMPVTEAMPELLQGAWYVQFHSSQYLNGVFRGYVVSVPEPGMGALGALAGAMIGFRKLTRRRGGTFEMAPQSGGQRLFPAFSIPLSSDLSAKKVSNPAPRTIFFDEIRGFNGSRTDSGS